MHPATVIKKKKPELPKVTYLRDVHEGAFVIKHPIKLVGDQRPGQNAEGYGDKITTDYMAVVKNKRYRVYAICWSNASSYYVIIENKKLFVSDFDVKDSE